MRERVRETKETRKIPFSENKSKRSNNNNEQKFCQGLRIFVLPIGVQIVMKIIVLKLNSIFGHENFIIIPFFVLIVESIKKI